MVMPYLHSVSQTKTVIHIFGSPFVLLTYFTRFSGHGIQQCSCYFNILPLPNKQLSQMVLAGNFCVFVLFRSAYPIDDQIWWLRVVFGEF